MYQEKSFFISDYITTCLFAKFFRVTKCIQIIVLHLECNAQFFSKLV